MLKGMLIDLEDKLSSYTMIITESSVAIYQTFCISKHHKYISKRLTNNYYLYIVKEDIAGNKLWISVI